jgi:Zn-dependent protease with chaperone function
MSAFNSTETRCFAGQYCDGQRAIAYPVNALFSNTHLVIVAPDIHRTVHLSELRVSEALGSLSRTFTFEDGATLVVPTSDEIVQHVAQSRPILQLLESKYRYAVAALALILGATWWIYSCAIPFMADEVVARFGTAWESGQSESTLARADAAGIWKPSKLDEIRQSQARLLIAERLRFGHLDPQHIVFRDSPDLGANAFALDGGDMVLTDDLMQLLSLDEQIAVVAHELGHVHQRHSQRLWLRQLGSWGAMRLLIGTNSSTDPVAVTTQLLGQTRYSRDFEAEADSYALGLLTESGISPCHLATGLKKLETASAVQGRMQSEWFSSHPLTQDRIANFAGSCPVKG